MTAPERPVIFAHNEFKEGVFLEDWTSQLDILHTPEQALDGLRDTFWSAFTAAAQTTPFRVANLLVNGTWQDSSVGWGLVLGATSVGTYARQSTVVLEGDGAGEIDITTYGATEVNQIHSDRRYTLKAGVTYHIAFAAKSALDSALDAKMILFDSAGVAKATATVSAVTDVAWQGAQASFTPTVDMRGAYVALEAIPEVNTTYFDTAMFAPVRAVDSWAIDQAHDLRGATVKLETKLHPMDSWTTQKTIVPVDNRVIYETFAGVKAMWFRLDISSPILVPKLPGLWIGERFTLTHNPLSGWDSDERNTDSNKVDTDGGTSYIYKNWTKHGVNPNFSNIHPTIEFPAWKQWWEDTNEGVDAFWWINNPITLPDEMLLVLLTDTSFGFPFDEHLRSGGFSAEELLGALEVI